MTEQEDIKGYITFGPKDDCLYAIKVKYMPSKFQIWALRFFFGFDFVKEEQKNE